MKTRPIITAMLLSCSLLLLCSGAGGCNKAGEANTEGDAAMTTTEGQQGPANHLADEKSLYLQQHAHNPVDWYPWGDSAFEKAKTENKLIFLSSGYSSCHWCHVMEEEVFSQDDVAKLLNENFVCIKLDREERPDIDAVYMDALNYLNNGNVGWPMNVFLTPELKPFFGVTYEPKREFIFHITEIAKIWQATPAEITAPADQAQKDLASKLEFTKPGSIDKALFDDAAYLAEGRFDREWGGLSGGMGTKFPAPPIWQFMLHYYRKTGSPVAEKMLKKTLDNMASGGLRDHLGGGFHRYSVDRQWLVPHFEKMLYDNAQLALLYTEAAAVFDSAEYEEVARETLNFIVSDMSDKGHAFYSSYDADSEGVEGKYYVWTPAELINVAGEKDGKALAALLSITDTPNFTDHHGRVSGSVLTWRADIAKVAAEHGIGAEDAAGLLEKYRDELLAVRSKRVAPTLDRKVVTSWNGLALSALAQGYRTFGDPLYREAGEQTANWLWQQHVNADGSLVRASTDGSKSGSAVLDDYAFLARGYLDMYLATGEPEYLRHATQLIDYARTHFRHEQAGFYLTPDTVKQPLGERQAVYVDNVEPSGMAVLLDAILTAAAITGNEEYFALVEADLNNYAPLMKDNYINMARWLDVALLSEGPFYEVVIAGDAADPATQNMLRQVKELNPPYAVVVTVAAAGADAAMQSQLPIVVARTAINGKATAYVCQRGSCKQPTQDAAELLAQITEGWTK